ncbi:polyprenyl synthetase family protein [Halocatena halophila]|uniref:polyprenyl synthetase family protein n=1 Tax=Halocatena halophila TaxID=2814576 RepID=UPI002ED6BFFA
MNDQVIFVGGLHGSGADIVPQLLGQHPEIETEHGNEYSTKADEHLQSSFEPIEYFGGAGAFSFHPDTQIDPTDEYWSDTVLAEFRSAFDGLYQSDAAVGVQYSPTNIIRARLLAATFSNSVQLYIHRHPVLDGITTKERTKDRTQPLDSIVRHWLYSHERLLQEVHDLENCYVVSFHDLRRQPTEVLAPVFEAAGLSPVDIDAQALRSIGRDGWAGWLHSTDTKRAPIEQFEPEIRRFGYRLDEPAPVESPATEDIVEDPTSKQCLCPNQYVIPPSRATIEDVETPTDRILFVSFGTRGDVQPCIALARGFQQRGYDVRICSNEPHRELVEHHGVPFVSPHQEANIDVPIDPTATEKEQMDAFFDELSTFYDHYGTDIVETIAESSDWADCVVMGTAVFCWGLLYNYFDIPVVDIRFAPLYVDGDNVGEHPGIHNFFGNLTKITYAATGFGIDRALNEAYEELGISYRYDDEDAMQTFSRVNNTLTLRGYSPRVSDRGVPGLPDKTTGFWQIQDTVGEDQPLDRATRDFLTDGPAPICLNFGSAAIFGDDGAPWADDLLGSIQRTGRRCIAIGSNVPASVRSWAYHIDEVPHEALFEHCRAVIHHGGAGTTAACLRAGTPAIIVPSVTWADMPQWAEWIEREGAGIHVRNPADGFDRHLERIMEPSFQQRARAVGAALAVENGVETAIDAFEDHFESQQINRQRDHLAIRYIDSLPIADWHKRKLAGVALFNEPETIAGRTIERRDTFLETIKATSREFPAFDTDWPSKNRPLAVEKHDCPHEAASIERWNFQAYLETEAGERLSVFSLLSEREVDDEKLAHANLGAQIGSNGEKYERSIGDPRTPGHLVPELSRAPTTDYFSRALREVYEKNAFPDPDAMATTEPEIPREEFDYSMGDLSIEKGDEDYHVELEGETSTDGFGFSLRFDSQKEPVLPLEDGIMRGVTAGSSLFCYSFTRMDVTGHVVIDGERKSVAGSGWYNHQFGGDSDAGVALDNLLSRTHFRIHLDNDAELYAAIVTDLANDERLHDTDIMYVSPDGDRSRHTGTLERQRCWSSMRTYTEYGVEWKLSVPELDIDIEIAALDDDQEYRTIIAQPGFWNGPIVISGDHNGREIAGIGMCAQYGNGGDRSHYRTFLDDVSREVQRSVREQLPLEDMSDDRLQDLIARNGYDTLMRGVDTEAFVDAIVQPLRTIIDRGGKGWRSMCLLLCADAVGGDPQELRPTLALFELIHTGSLIVDDVEDNSDVRRGGPAAHKIYGDATAINSGTAGYFVCEPMLEAVGPTDEQWLRFYRLHNLSMRATHAGQGLDIHGWEHVVPDCLETGEFEPLWENLCATHRLKSAVPAMFAARLGVVLGEGGRETETIIGEYFFALGLAFQIVDDAINLRGYEHDLKEHAEDLVEGKVTAPIVRAFQVLDEPERTTLYQELQADEAEMDIHQIIDLVEGCGAVDWCYDYARELVDDAWRPVDAVLEESQAKMMLRAFSWFVVDVRDY